MEAKTRTRTLLRESIHEEKGNTDTNSNERGEKDILGRKTYRIVDGGNFRIHGLCFLLSNLGLLKVGWRSEMLSVYGVQYRLSTHPR